MLPAKRTKEIDAEVRRQSPLDLKTESNLQTFATAVKEKVDRIIEYPEQAPDLIMEAQGFLEMLQKELRMLQALEDLRTYTYNIEVAAEEAAEKDPNQTLGDFLA